MSGKTIVIWTIVLCGIFAAALTAVLVNRRHPIILKGAVLRLDTDPNKQLPIADVQITASNGLGTGYSKSDASGFFRLTLPKGLRRRQTVTLQFRHPNYLPLDFNDVITDKLYVVRMAPISPETRSESEHGDVVVSSVRVRYSVKMTTEADVGSAVKTFEVVNRGNVPCGGRPPCSPDGKWKAAIGSTSLDAGEGNQFRNIRVSCIAGPCPFAKIDLENLSAAGRNINVSARDWSDTTTFLLEAEVVHPMVGDIVRESYPVIFGRTLNFSLPPTAEGASIEAEIDKEAILFPLGPNLFLRWADCHVETETDQSKAYRCELKRGYRF